MISKCSHRHGIDTIIIRFRCLFLNRSRSHQTNLLVLLTFFLFKHRHEPRILLQLIWNTKREKNTQREREDNFAASKVPILNFMISVKMLKSQMLWAGISKIDFFVLSQNDYPIIFICTFDSHQEACKNWSLFKTSISS